MKIPSREKSVGAEHSGPPLLSALTAFVGAFSYLWGCILSFVEREIRLHCTITVIFQLEYRNRLSKAWHWKNIVSPSEKTISPGPNLSHHHHR